MRPNHRSLFTVAALSIILALFVARLSAVPSASSPFQPGKTYQVYLVAGSFKAKVVTPPDSSGWAKVTIIESKTFDRPRGTILLNTQTVLMVEEVEAK